VDRAEAAETSVIFDDDVTGRVALLAITTWFAI